MMVQARYTCSVNVRRIIWWLKVIFESDSCSLARA